MSANVEPVAPHARVAAAITDIAATPLRMHTPQPVPIVDDDEDDGGSGGGNIDPDDDEGWSDDDEDDEDETLWTFQLDAGFTGNVYRSSGVAAGECRGIP